MYLVALRSRGNRFAALAVHLAHLHGYLNSHVVIQLASAATERCAIIVHQADNSCELVVDARDCGGRKVSCVGQGLGQEAFDVLQVWTPKSGNGEEYLSSVE